MIQKELYAKREDGVNLYRTFSDLNVCIEQQQTKAIYEEAIDTEDSNYTYIETDIPITKSETPEEPIHPRPPIPNNVH